MNINYEIDYGVYSHIREFYTTLDVICYKDHNLYYDVRGTREFEFDAVDSIYFSIEAAIDAYEY